MNEQKRIANLFKQLFNGHPWIDVNIVESLSTITAKQAASRPLQECNTIWEIVNHMVAWRKNVLCRMNDEVIETPSHNYFEPVTDQSEEAWAQTKIDLENSQSEWAQYLEQLDTKEFDKIYPITGLTYYEHILGIVQHDAYHLGQIVMLRKVVSNE
jgi:uncharacterized damage-inducible protein DinB